MSFSSKLMRESTGYEIKVFEKGTEISYSACGLPYYVSGEVEDIKDLQAKTIEDFKKEGIEVLLNHEVTKVDFNKKVVYGKDFEESYDKLVVASGASPIVINFGGKSYDNVFTLSKMEDAYIIREKLKDDNIKNITIVGGGYIGLEMADAFILQGKNVRIIEGKDRIVSTMDKEITDIIEKYLEDKLEIIKNTIVKDIVGHDKIEKVITDKGEFDTDLLLLSVGFKPETAYLDDIKKMDNGTIIINEKMETSVKDVYAVGDCASKINLLTGENMSIYLGTYANRQGKLLAEIFSGKDYSMPKIIGTNMMRIGELEVAATGLGENMAKEYYDADSIWIKKNKYSGYITNEKEYCKLIYDKESKKILGAQILGTSGTAVKIDAFALAIENGLTSHKLEYSDFAYQPTLSSLWDIYQIAAARIK